MEQIIAGGLIAIVATAITQAFQVWLAHINAENSLRKDHVQRVFDYKEERLNQARAAYAAVMDPLVELIRLSGNARRGDIDAEKLAVKLNETHTRIFDGIRTHELTVSLIRVDPKLAQDFFNQCIECLRVLANSPTDAEAMNAYGNCTVEMVKGLRRLEDDLLADPLALSKS